MWTGLAALDATDAGEQRGTLFDVEAERRRAVIRAGGQRGRRRAGRTPARRRRSPAPPAGRPPSRRDDTNAAIRVPAAGEGQGEAHRRGRQRGEAEESFSAAMRDPLDPAWAVLARTEVAHHLGHVPPRYLVTSVSSRERLSVRSESAGTGASSIQPNMASTMRRHAVTCRSMAEPQ